MRILTLGLLVSGLIAAAALPRIVSLKVTPSVIHPGDVVTVTWVTRDAESVAIEWMPVLNPQGPSENRDGLPPTGSFKTSLRESSIFVLSCRNPTGLCSRSVTARVKVAR